METALDISQSELLDALRAATNGDGEESNGGGLTSREVQQQLGFGQNKVLSILRQGIEDGSVEAIQLRRKNIVGTLTKTWCYRTTTNGNGASPDPT